ncbi:MAG TPA: AI-2E family transporter [Aquaticitalea sp.]|nr:AI-2E family transporter [Aquaticitalea sp.]
MKQIPAQIIRQLFTLLLIAFMGILIFREMLPYLTGVLGALTLYILLRKWMVTLVIRKSWNPALAAVFLMFLSFVGILVPIVGVVWMLGNKIGKAVNNSEQVINAAKTQIAKVEQYVGFDINSQIDTGAITAWISQSLQNVAGGTFNAFVAVGLMYFMLFYMLTNRRLMKDSLKEYIPLSRENISEVGTEVQSMVRSNALGIPLVAIVQGVVALIGFWIFGIENAFFWFVITTIGSMIPFIGTLLGIIPVFLIALAGGDSFQAWGILLYGFIVVGTSDNIVRLYVLKKLDDVHPLITLIGVIIGVPIFGFIGLIFGPLLISLFIAMLRIYKKEYGNDDTSGNKSI